MPTDSYTLTAGQATQMREAVGAGMGLTTPSADPAIPPVPRNATVQECHDYWVGQMKAFVKAHKRRINEKAALAAVVDTAFDIT